MKETKGTRSNLEISADNIKDDAINAAEIIKVVPANTKLTFDILKKESKINIDINTTADKQLRFDFSDITTGAVIVDDDPAPADDGALPSNDDAIPLWVWSDPFIFDKDTRQLFLSLPQGERPRFVADAIDKFYAERPEYGEFAKVTIYREPAQLLAFFKSLTLEDFEKCNLFQPAERFSDLQNMINQVEAALNKTPLDPDKLITIWPVLSLRESFLESELAALYYLKFPRISPKELAKEKGAIMSIGGRLADISNKDYSGWLDEKPNKYAYISYTGDKHYFDRINADPDGNLYEQLQRSVSEQDKRARKAIKDGRFYDGRPTRHEHINTSILQALLKVSLDNPRNDDDRYFYIHVPALAKELNEHYITNLDEYDAAGNLKEDAAQQREEAAEAEEAAKEAGEKMPYNPPNFMDLITDLNYWVGVINNMPTQIISINQVDYASNTIRIDSPFIYDVMRAQADKSQLDAEKKGTKKINPGYDYLLHSSIATEKDKIAVDLARTIINRILQRGSKNYDPDEEERTEPKDENKTITLKIKYKDLIDETPTLKMAYNGASSKYKYDILNRKFKTAFKILRNKTDIYKYYIDLNIPNTPPTTRTLNSCLVITHQGINKNYKIKRP